MTLRPNLGLFLYQSVKNTDKTLILAKSLNSLMASPCSQPSLSFFTILNFSHNDGTTTWSDPRLVALQYHSAKTSKFGGKKLIILCYIDFNIYLVSCCFTSRFIPPSSYLHLSLTLW